MLKRTAKAFLSDASRRSGLLRGYRRFGPPRISILMYHRIQDEPDPLGLSVSVDDFDRQIRLVKERYPVIPLDQAVEDLRSGRLDRHGFVVTFDDGYRDNFTGAYPVLRRHGVSAVIYVTCDALDTGHFGWSRFDRCILDASRPELDLAEAGLGRYSLRTPESKAAAVRELHRDLKRMADVARRRIMTRVLEILGEDSGDGTRVMLSWEEARTMAESGLVTIGSHTLTHPILTRIPERNAREEIERSKHHIEAKLGRDVHHFAYPNGGPADFNAGIAGLARESGYRSACATIPGTNRPGTDLFALRRIAVTPDTYRGLRGEFSESLFAARISALWDGVLFRS